MTKEEMIKDLAEQRNEIVKKYDNLKNPLRTARKEGREVDWVLWDNLDRRMNQELYPIDLELWKLGRV